jgi:hypothetical protein
VNVTVVNEFWVAGDFVINLATGATQEVLRLATSAGDASAFGLKTATDIKQFVESRVNSRPGKNPAVRFEVVHSERPQGLWIVHGVQEVEIDDES